MKSFELSNGAVAKADGEGERIPANPTDRSSLCVEKDVELARPTAFTHRFFQFDKTTL